MPLYMAKKACARNESDAWVSVAGVQKVLGEKKTNMAALQHFFIRMMRKKASGAAPSALNVLTQLLDGPRL